MSKLYTSLKPKEEPTPGPTDLTDAQRESALGLFEDNDKDPEYIHRKLDVRIEWLARFKRQNNMIQQFMDAKVICPTGEQPSTQIAMLDAIKAHTFELDGEPFTLSTGILIDIGKRRIRAAAELEDDAAAWLLYREFGVYHYENPTPVA